MSEEDNWLTWEVWRKPDNMPAQFVGTIKANIFMDACRMLCSDSIYFHVDDEGNAFDRGRLWPSETSANNSGV